METDTQRLVRLDKPVRIEALFRTVNDKLRELNVEFEAFVDTTALFVCECSRLDCIQQIELPVAMFDEVSARPDRFVLVPGHETLGPDVVVARGDGYVVVEPRRLS